MNQRKLFAVILAGIITAALPVGAAANDAKDKRVLYLNSYDRGYKWSDDIERGLVARLQNAARKIELSVEYLDGRRFPGTARYDLMAETLAAKYAGYRHDVLVVSDNFAFDFALQYRKLLFPELPIVFCGYNNLQPDVLKGISKITGVNEEVDFAKTVELAIRVQPTVRHFAFIISTTDASNRRMAAVAEATLFPELRKRYHLIVLKDASMADISARLIALPPDSAVILLGMTSDLVEGRRPTPIESGCMILEASPVPVYSFWDFHLGTGILGGHIITGMDQGRTAADMVLRVLGGTPADNIPVMMQTPARNILDFNVMKKYGIKMHAMPEGCSFVNRPVSLWESYGGYIGAALLAISLESLLIIVLVVSLRQRKEALRMLGVERDLLEQRVEERSRALQCANEQLQTKLAERNRISDIFQTRAQLFEYSGKHCLDELIEETLNAVERLTESQISFYHFVNSDQKTLVLQNWSTKTKDSFCSASGKGLHYEIAQAGVWVDCFHQRKPVIHNDYESLKHKKGLPPGHAKVVRELVVPVFRRTQIVAILGVGNKPTDYDQHDVQVVSMFADLAWDIAEQKRGEQRIRRLNETLEQRVADRTTELENRAQQLQQLALELTEAEDLERRRIASILHDDFQQELAYIKLELAILQNEAELNNIQKRLEFLVPFIEKCVEKSRNLSYEINPQALLQSGLLVALRELAHNMKTRFGLNVTVHAQHNAEPHSSVLASILFRSIKELLFNVIKHACVNSAIMDIRSKNETIYIRIKDLGKGFAYDPARPRFNRETGFGLWNIEDRITFLGGHMKINTAPGKGCCIELIVPKDVSRKDSIHEPSREETPRQECVDIVPASPLSCDERHQIHIVLADDHQMVREAMAKVLKDCKGMTVVGQANDGSEAVRFAARLKPHVILMDVTMPVLDGFEATAQIKKDNPDIRIIGLSVQNDAHTRQKMLQVGASAYLTKSASPVTLIETIRKVYSGNIGIDSESEK
jgi:signal transduction histidine kinase/ActR/RegA family two-component response regulator